MIGDYNALLGAHEHRDRGIPNQLSCGDFRDWTDECNLIHLTTKGAFFTWSNGRKGVALTERRLDRVCCNDDWLSSWSEVSRCTLNRSQSGHFPILMTLKKNAISHASSFKFMKMWAEHDDCFNLIATSWNTSVSGYPMFILSQKLKTLKNALKSWNKDKFGNVHAKVKSAEENVNRIQQQISISGYSDALMDQEKITQYDLNQALHFQELFWKEKSVIDWQNAGDRYTSFFSQSC